MRNKPEIIVAPDLSKLVQLAVDRVEALVSQAGPTLAICLTGGSTPKPLYQRLASEPYRSRLPWNRIHWFWGDDRFVPPKDERSNFGMARAAFLDHLPIPPAHVHAMPTTAADPHTAALQYEEELKRFYGGDQLDPKRPLFDLVLMGLGSDGHTASLFPGDPSVSEMHRWVVGVEQAGLAPFIPRVSLTFPAMASTKEMLFLVSGQEKRDIVNRVLSGQDLPAAHAYANGSFVWLMDKDALPERLSAEVASSNR